MATLLPDGKQSYTTATGAPLVGGRLYTYDAGTSTPRPTYSDAAGLVPNTNPVIMDARGEAVIFWAGAYKATLKDAADATIWTVDNIISAADVADAAMRADLASTASAAKNAGQVGYNKLLAYLAGTVGRKLQEIFSVLDFGGDPTGAADSASAFAAAAATGKLVFRPKGAYKRGAVTRVYPTDGIEGVLWIGNGIINNSDDSQVVVSRDVDATGAGNAHSYSDSSIYNRPNTSHNSYDDRTKTIHASAAGHHASFQAGVEIAVPGGVFGNLYSFITNTTVSAGTLTNFIGLTIGAPAYSGTGAVVNCYGVYFPLGYGKGAFPFNNASGVVTAIQNESAAMIYSLGAVQGQNGLIAGNGAGTAYVNIKTIDAVTNAGTLVGLRLQQVGTQIFDFEIPANQIYMTLSNVAGEVARWDAAKNMVLQPAVAAPALTVNGQLVFNPTSNTNLRISHRGSDGVTRVANITMA